MNLMGRSLRWKFNLLILVSLVGFALTMAFTVRGFTVVNSNFQTFAQIGTEVQYRVLCIARDQALWSKGCRTILLGDDQPKVLAQVKGLTKNIEANFDALTRIATNLESEEQVKFQKMLDRSKADTIATLNDGNQRVANYPASDEQVRASHEVGTTADAVRSESSMVASATREQTATVEEVSKTSHDLARTADGLNTEILRFKL